MTEPESIKEFYEEFADHLFRDRLQPNLRQREAMKLVDAHLRPGDRVCEIGCGIGIMTQHASRRVGPRGGILATDLSESNIALARRTASRPNITYRSGDVFEYDFEGRTFDVVLLFDVFEHIPIERRRELGGKLAGLLGPEGRMLITVPSPEYQEHLRAHEPHLLQVVDNVVTLDAIRELAALTGTAVRLWAYRDAFTRNQYVHVVLARGEAYRGVPVRPPLWRRLWWKGVVYNPVLNALRRRRYRSPRP